MSDSSPIIWRYNPIDDYTASVSRTGKQFLAYLVVAHGDDILHQELVVLFFDAVFGPDPHETAHWQKIADKHILDYMLGESAAATDMATKLDKRPVRGPRPARAANANHPARVQIKDLAVPQLVNQLIAEIRRPIVQELVGIRDPKIVDAWLTGKARPGDRHEYVLRLALELTQSLRRKHTAQYVIRWLAERKTWLRGSAPLSVLNAIASGEVRESQLAGFRKSLLSGATSSLKL
jgi:hypothetical protein